jgi:hypothetical protein
VFDILLENLYNDYHDDNINLLSHRRHITQFTIAPSMKCSADYSFSTTESGKTSTNASSISSHIPLANSMARCKHTYDMGQVQYIIRKCVRVRKHTVAIRRRLSLLRSSLRQVARYHIAIRLYLLISLLWRERVAAIGNGTLTFLVRMIRYSRNCTVT